MIGGASDVFRRIVYVRTALLTTRQQLLLLNNRAFPVAGRLQAGPAKKPIIRQSGISFERQ